MVNSTTGSQPPTSPQVSDLSLSHVQPWYLKTSIYTLTHYHGSGQCRLGKRLSFTNKGFATSMLVSQSVTGGPTSLCTVWRRRRSTRPPTQWSELQAHLILPRLATISWIYPFLAGPGPSGWWWLGTRPCPKIVICLLLTVAGKNGQTLTISSTSSQSSKNIKHLLPHRRDRIPCACTFSK